MTTYKFESVDTTAPADAENVAYALIGAFAALASTVVGDSKQKQEEFFRKLDQALHHNERASSYTELARIAQIMKASLS